MAQLVFKRQEVKYCLTEGQRARLMVLLARHMVPDKHGASTVRNVYYDTPTSLIIRRSLEHPLYKEKIRVRSYVDVRGGDKVFVELKKKFKGIVYKRRVTLPVEEARALLDGTREPQSQIEREIAYAASTYEGLRPAMYVAYDREAFYDPDDHEFRVTFDRNVRARLDHVTLGDGTYGRQLLDESLCLMEVKTCGGMPLWLADFLAKERIFKASFSKYGAAYRQLVAAPTLERAPRRVAQRASQPALACAPRHLAPIG